MSCHEEEQREGSDRFVEARPGQEDWTMEGYSPMSSYHEDNFEDREVVSLNGPSLPWVNSSPDHYSPTSRNAKMLQIPVNQGRNNAFDFYAASAWNQFQKWLIDTNIKQTPRRQHSLREECALRKGLGIKCCCGNNYCKNVNQTRPLTEKELMLKQQKVDDRALKHFKKQLKEWIWNEIPQD